MGVIQIKQYLEFIAPRTSVLLSENPDQSRVDPNEVSVTSLLNEYFDLKKLPLWNRFSQLSESRLKKIVRKIFGFSLLTLLRALRQMLNHNYGYKPIIRYLAIPKCHR